MSCIFKNINPYAHNTFHFGGELKRKNSDFIVEEKLPFQPSGEGEHIYLLVKKNGENTDFVARQLAGFAELRPRDVGFTGLKDRHAITKQWFSLWMPGKKDLDWTSFQKPNIEILEVVRHHKKLKRGVLIGNQFQITVRDFLGDWDRLQHLIDAVLDDGVPNYFGVQRFGSNGQNVEKALNFFKGKKANRQQRSIYLSAARSFLFNQMLAARVQDSIWNKGVNGDVLMFDQSNSYFRAETLNANDHQRIQAKQLHPTGIMFGEGELETSQDAADYELKVLQDFPEIAEGLKNSGLKMQRRALRVSPNDLKWNKLDDSSFLVQFFLPAGAYATVLLRELVDYKIVSRF